MQYNNELITDLTITIPPEEEVYIKINGLISIGVLGTTIEAGTTYIVQSSLDSSEAFDLATTHSDLSWEDISIDGVTYTELSFAITSISFIAPNFLYIKNESVTDSMKVSLRGNRA